MKNRREWPMPSIDYEKEYISNIGRPFKLADKGKPIDFLLV